MTSSSELLYNLLEQAGAEFDGSTGIADWEGRWEAQADRFRFLDKVILIVDAEETEFDFDDQPRLLCPYCQHDFPERGEDGVLDSDFSSIRDRGWCHSCREQREAEELAAYEALPWLGEEERE